MPVYIDNFNATYKRGYRTMKMCHMIADTLQELHAMADTIGVNRRWFQAQASIPHYDVCLTKKQLAITHGAIEVDRRTLVKKIREYRARYQHASV